MRRAQRAEHHVSAGRGVKVRDEEAPVPALADEELARCGARAADRGGELRGPRDGHEPRGPRAQFPEVEAEERGRVEAAEAAEEGGVGGVPEPAPRDVGGADEGSGEGEAQQDLTEEVVVAEHR